MELRQLGKFKALKKKYAYEMALDKEAIDGMDDFELFEVLLIMDFDQQIIGCIEDYLDYTNTQDQLIPVLTVMAKTAGNMVGAVQNPNPKEISVAIRHAFSVFNQSRKGEF